MVWLQSGTRLLEAVLILQLPPHNRCTLAPKAQSGCQPEELLSHLGPLWVWGEVPCALPRPHLTKHLCFSDKPDLSKILHFA